jgi:hypothetical protein
VRELEGAVAAGRLATRGLAGAGAAGAGPEPPGLLRADVVALWPPADLLTEGEARALAQERLPLCDRDAKEWLGCVVDSGKVERFPGFGDKVWRASSHPSREGRGQDLVPGPELWRVRESQLSDLLQAEQERSGGNPWRTRDPGTTAPPWVGRDVARALVVRASGFGPERATEWLAAHSVGSAPPLRARFAPASLAGRERASWREGVRVWSGPGLSGRSAMTFSDGAGRDSVAVDQTWADICLWYPPETALASGRCPGSGLTGAEVEWHADELWLELARAFATGAAPAGRAAGKGAGGAPRKYPWDVLGAAFGAWLHQEPGRADLEERHHLKALGELATRLGPDVPERSPRIRGLSCRRLPAVPGRRGTCARIIRGSFRTRGTNHDPPSPRAPDLPSPRARARGAQRGEGCQGGRREPHPPLRADPQRRAAHVKVGSRWLMRVEALRRWLRRLETGAA